MNHRQAIEAYFDYWAQGFNNLVTSSGESIVVMDLINVQKIKERFQNYNIVANW